MNEQQDKELRSLLRMAVPPVGRRELDQDLWPRMLRRLDHESRRMPWFDYAVAGLAVAGFIAFPEVIPWVLFQC